MVADNCQRSSLSFEHTFSDELIRKSDIFRVLLDSFLWVDDEFLGSQDNQLILMNLSDGKHVKMHRKCEVTVDKFRNFVYFEFKKH